jgi:hypothetical protein
VEAFKRTAVHRPHSPVAAFDCHQRARVVGDAAPRAPPTRRRAFLADVRRRGFAGASTVRRSTTPAASRKPSASANSASVNAPFSASYAATAARPRWRRRYNASASFTNGETGPEPTSRSRSSQTPASNDTDRFTTPYQNGTTSGTTRHMSRTSDASGRMRSRINRVLGAERCTPVGNRATDRCSPVADACWSVDNEESVEAFAANRTDPVLA